MDRVFVDRLATAFLLLWAVIRSAGAQPNDGDRYADVIAKAEGAVVSISRVSPHQFNSSRLQDFRLVPGDGDGRSEPGHPDFLPTDFGAGILLKSPVWDDAVVLTNYHVVRGGPRVGVEPRENEQRLFVQFAKSPGVYAAIFAADPRSDLAILKLDETGRRGAGERLPTLKLGDATDFRKGNLILTLGNPFAISRDGSVSAGLAMLSNLARRPVPELELGLDERSRKPSIHHLGTLWHLDGRMNLGTSGGAALNLDGSLVGITTSLAAIDGYEKSAGFVIPFDRSMRRVVDELLAGHEVEYGFLGIGLGEITADLPARLRGGRRSGWAVRATNVGQYSPADRGGLESGDWILDVEGVPVHSGGDLMRMVGLNPPGASLALRVYRPDAGGLIDLKVELGKWPVADDEGIIATTPKYPPWRGIHFDYVSGRWRYLTSPPQFFPAVLVTDVDAGSRAKRAEVKSSDLVSHVNGVAVETPAQFVAATNGLRGTVKLRLIDGREVLIDE